MVDLKILFVGSPKVGKTSLIRSIVYGVLRNDSMNINSSVDDSGTLEKHIMQSWSDGDDEFTLELIDSVYDGDKKDEVVMSLNVKDADLVVACYDLNNLSTLDALRDYYLPMIQAHQQLPIVLCVGTKHDSLKEDATFSLSLLREKLLLMRNMHPFMEAAFFCSTTYTDHEATPFTVVNLKQQIELHASYPIGLLYSNGSITDATKQSLYRIFFSLDTQRAGTLSHTALQRLREICGIELKPEKDGPVTLSRYFQLFELLLQKGMHSPVIALLKAFRVKFHRNKGSKGRKGIVLQQVVPLHIIHRTPPVLHSSWYSSVNMSRYILFHNYSIEYTDDAKRFLQYLWRTWTSNSDMGNKSITSLIAISRDDSEIQSWNFFPLVGQVSCDKLDQFFPQALPASTSNNNDNNKNNDSVGTTENKTGVIASEEECPFLLEDSIAFADTSLTQEGVEVNSFELCSPFAVSYFHHPINGSSDSNNSGSSEQIWLKHWHMLLCTRGPSYVQELLYRMGYSRSNEKLQKSMIPPLLGALFGKYTNSDDSYGLTLIPKKIDKVEKQVSSKRHPFHLCILGNKYMDNFLWELLESAGTIYSNESQQLTISDPSSYHAMRLTTGKRILSTTLSHSNREVVVSAVGSTLASRYCYNMLNFNANMCILVFEEGNRLQYQYCIHQDTEVLPEYVSRVFVCIRTSASKRVRDTDKEVKRIQEHLEGDCEDYLRGRGLPSLLVIDISIDINDNDGNSDHNRGRAKVYQTILDNILQHSFQISDRCGGKSRGSIFKRRIAIALEISKTVTPLLLSAVLFTITLNMLLKNK